MHHSLRELQCGLRRSKTKRQEVYGPFSLFQLRSLPGVFHSPHYYSTRASDRTPTHLPIRSGFHELNHLEDDVENEDEGVKEGWYEHEEPIPFHRIVHFVSD